MQFFMNSLSPDFWSKCLVVLCVILKSSVSKMFIFRNKREPCEITFDDFDGLFHFMCYICSLKTFFS